eukprot:CAMPEP_0171546678 /NCGR_PEP_ID=MMETSP0960-20121227/4765_1 /TAXON_ID=87120 /ORGANISM="Aurantiochytrium limacinum, Strain ATCCMYA-1381" /LENGTH=433 /DNA_ID=CAMNT_0012094775 /DNA_START=301 /DNA_END=1601 /DNA_ORIENTATION=+
MAHPRCARDIGDELKTLLRKESKTGSGGKKLLVLRVLHDILGKRHAMESEGKTLQVDFETSWLTVFETAVTECLAPSQPEKMVVSFNKYYEKWKSQKWLSTGSLAVLDEQRRETLRRRHSSPSTQAPAAPHGLRRDDRDLGRKVTFIDSKRQNSEINGGTAHPLGKGTSFTSLSSSASESNENGPNGVKSSASTSSPSREAAGTGSASDTSSFAYVPPSARQNSDGPGEIRRRSRSPPMGWRPRSPPVGGRRDMSPPRGRRSFYPLVDLVATLVIGIAVHGHPHPLMADALDHLPLSVDDGHDLLHDAGDLHHLTVAMDVVVRVRHLVRTAEAPPRSPSPGGLANYNNNDTGLSQKRNRGGPRDPSPPHSQSPDRRDQGSAPASNNAKASSNGSKRRKRRRKGRNGGGKGNNNGESAQKQNNGDSAQSTDAQK